MDPITIAALIAAGSSLVGGVAQRGGGRRAIDRQNEYNKPINQLARLREAGLPYAAMTDAISGNQSQPQEINDLGLGDAGRTIAQFASTRIQKKQAELIDAEITNKNADVANKNADTKIKEIDAAIRSNDLTLSTDRMQYEMNKDGNDTLLGLGQYSNQVRGIVRERNYKEAQLFTERNKNELMSLDYQLRKAKNEADIKQMGLDYEMRKGKTDAEIKQMGLDYDLRKSMNSAQINEIEARINNLCLQAGLTQQAINQNNVVQTLIDQIAKDGISTTEAFFHLLLNGGIRTTGLSNLLPR